MMTMVTPARARAPDGISSDVDASAEKGATSWVTLRVNITKWYRFEIAIEECVNVGVVTGVGEYLEESTASSHEVKATPESDGI